MSEVPFSRAVSHIEYMTNQWWAYFPEENKIIRAYEQNHLLCFVEYADSYFANLCFDEPITRLISRQNKQAIFSFHLRCITPDCNCLSNSLEEWLIFDETKEVRLTDEEKRRISNQKT